MNLIFKMCENGLWSDKNTKITKNIIDRFQIVQSYSNTSCCNLWIEKKSYSVYLCSVFFFYQGHSKVQGYTHITQIVKGTFQNKFSVY